MSSAVSHFIFQMYLPIWFPRYTKFCLWLFFMSFFWLVLTCCIFMQGGENRRILLDLKTVLEEVQLEVKKEEEKRSELQLLYTRDRCSWELEKAELKCRIAQVNCGTLKRSLIVSVFSLVPLCVRPCCPVWCKLGLRLCHPHDSVTYHLGVHPARLRHNICALGYELCSLSLTQTHCPV